MSIYAVKRFTVETTVIAGIKTRQQFTIKTSVECMYGELLLHIKQQITVEVAVHCIYGKLLNRPKFTKKNLRGLTPKPRAPLSSDSGSATDSQFNLYNSKLVKSEHLAYSFKAYDGRDVSSTNLQGKHITYRRTNKSHITSFNQCKNKLSVCFIVFSILNYSQNGELPYTYLNSAL